ncbi:MAG: SDR family oxidoreductase [Roseobacter sp.]|jgi:NAD(P)-dependent dehydrogenase (short-subunit alcohol dehydrogenase family)
MTDLSGKTAIITGASRGIGAATALHLADLGATVVLAARNTRALEKLERQIRDAGGKADPISCDVARAEDVRRLIDVTLLRHGRLDLMVNNAGVIDPIARLADSDPAAWGTIMDINLKGVYYGLRYAIPEMIARGGGTIINISSGAATSALEGWSHYCATKAAVLSLTRTTHKEYAAQGIRVLGLSPGTVATGMQSSIRASGINPVSQLNPNVHISPEWVARAIAWLTTAEADVYRGTDFSLKTNEGRTAVGLTPVPA